MKQTVLWCVFTLFASLLFAQQQVVFMVQDSTNSFDFSLSIDNEILLSGSANQPLNFSLPEGTHLVQIFAAGYSLKMDSIRIQNGAQNQFMYRLSKLNKDLKALEIVDQRVNHGGLMNLRAVDGFGIYAAKKNEVILPDELHGNLATNNARQIYARVPGLSVWESDRSGIQLNIAARGLDPGRTANFNTRQNGYDIAADALGYPEAYYTPPPDAVEQIEVVRGAAALQYGPQFGGLLNFKLKEGAPDKKLSINHRQTVGSFGLYNLYNAVGGTVKNTNYIAIGQYKRGESWRPNGQFEQVFLYAAINTKLTKQWSLKAAATYMDYLAQQPGGLTDAQFESNPFQSNRSRNWFSATWKLLNLNATYELSPNSRFQANLFALDGTRKSLGFLSYINRADPLAERQFFNDRYRNIGAEFKFLHQYKIGEQLATLLLGYRAYQGETDRQQGFGSSGADADFRFVNQAELPFSSYTFPSVNHAFFVENIFWVNKQWSITPGVRVEHIATRAKGTYTTAATDLAGNLLLSDTSTEQLTNVRQFPLFGMGVAYKFSSTDVESYANFSQNYRAVNFNDIRAVNGNIDVDPAIKDEYGYSADIGLRGLIKPWLRTDISFFTIKYNDRIGVVWRMGNPKPLRTNVADAWNVGVEWFAELLGHKLFTQSPNWQWSVFTNYAYIHSTYVNAIDKNIEGKMVELVPQHNFKAGIMLGYKKLSAQYQHTFISQQFTDATNATFANNAAAGVIPAYQVADFSVKYEYKRFSFASGINNIFNEIYFTQRADGYPGPGILPSDIRNWYFTLGIKW